MMPAPCLTLPRKRERVGLVRENSEWRNAGTHQGVRIPSPVCGRGLGRELESSGVCLVSEPASKR